MIEKTNRATMTMFVIVALFYLFRLRLLESALKHGPYISCAGASTPRAGTAFRAFTFAAI